VSPLDAFQPLSLVSAARQLEVHPFELVRILVACEALPEDLTLRPDALPNVSRMAGLERWWDDGRLDQVDPLPRSVAVALCAKLSAHAAEAPTRFDNVFRGMSAAHQPVARRVVQRLTQAGLLRTTPTPTGMHLAIAEDQAPLVALIGQGEVPENLGI